MKKAVYSLIALTMCSALHAGGMAASRAISRTMGGKSCNLAITFDTGLPMKDFSSAENGFDVVSGNPTITNIDNVLACDFDGNDKIDLTSIPENLVPRTGPFTTSVGFRTTFDFGVGSLLDADKASADGDWLNEFLGSDLVRGLVADNSLNLATRSSDAVLNDGNWHQMTIVWIPPVLSQYVDGQLQGTATNASVGDVNFGGPTWNWTIGDNSAFSRPFTGTEDEVFIFKRGLSAAEVGRLFQQFTAGRE